jgi:hypothetical protein
MLISQIVFRRIIVYILVGLSEQSWFPSLVRPERRPLHLRLAAPRRRELWPPGNCRPRSQAHDLFCQERGRRQRRGLVRQDQGRKDDGGEKEEETGR